MKDIYTQLQQNLKKQSRIQSKNNNDIAIDGRLNIQRRLFSVICFRLETISLNEFEHF